MNKGDYDVSVVLAIYNVEEFLRDAIDSLIKQKYDFSKIEVILVNDGSQDSSLSICKEYVKQYNNIKIIDKKNGGVSSARNAGIKNSLGRYIMILDPDDWISPVTVKHLVSFMNNNSCSIAAYKVMNYTNGKLKEHYRNSFFVKGTGIYSIEEYPYISQTTVNIIFKNRFEENALYDERLHYAEDEKLDTQLIMLDGKIGYVKEATYFYRKNVNGQASEQYKNPLYCFDYLIENYAMLFKKYKDKQGHIPFYIQGLFLNAIRWRIAGDLLLPYYKEGKEYKESIKQLYDLIKQLDTKLIIHHPTMHIYHKFYLLQIKNSSIDVCVEDNHFLLKEGEQVLETISEIDLKINRFQLKGEKLSILGTIGSVLFWYKDAILYCVTIDKMGQKKRWKLDLFFSNWSCYQSKMEVAKIYGFDLQISIKEIEELYFEIEIDKKIFYGEVSFSLYIPFHKKLRLTSYMYQHRMIQFQGRGFTFKKANIISLVKAYVPRLGLMLLKRPSAMIDRIKYKKYKKRKIWLYCGKTDRSDNVYIQFQHDIKIADGIDRYYIIDEKLPNENTLFTKEQMNKFVILKSSKEDIYFHLACSKIITSFSSINEYTPFTLRELKFYNDLLHYDVVYLQNGVLHANLVNMYSKEFTEIGNIVISSAFEKNNLIHKYNYKEKDLLLTGVPRFSKLPIISKRKKKILWAPSWRAYLVQNVYNKSVKKVMPKVFLNSTFYKAIQAIISSKKLNDLLKEKNVTLDLKLHPLFKEYGNYFKTIGSQIHVVEEVEEEEYSLFITDISSYQFDFVWMHVPILYYLPDKLEFMAGLHTYRKLDLPLEEVFGEVVYDKKELVKYIKEYLDTDFKLKKKYQERMDNFFVKDKNKDIMDTIYKTMKGNKESVCRRISNGK